MRTTIVYPNNDVPFYHLCCACQFKRNGRTLL